MTDDRNGSLVLDPASVRASAAPRPSAEIIAFPGRYRKPEPVADTPATDGLVAVVVQTVLAALEPRVAAHGPTVISSLGALAGFAAQQMLLLEGGSAWMQPKRAEHLDRLLLSDRDQDRSLWHQLKVAAHGVGAHHLPDPNKLLQSTLRCVGTTQFGLITLPLEYKLLQQPKDALAILWAPLASAVHLHDSAAKLSPLLLACVCARYVAMEHRTVPPHVAVRVAMQAALAMALIEPRQVQGAAIK